MLCYFMVPGILIKLAFYQFGILSTGQTYFQTPFKLVKLIGDSSLFVTACLEMIRPRLVIAHSHMLKFAGGEFPVLANALHTSTSFRSSLVHLDFGQ